MLMCGRWRHSRRCGRGGLVAFVGVCTAALLVGCGDRVLDAGSPQPGAAQVPQGWRAVSSVGVEIFVPAGWKTNDTRCGQTAAPSVVRGHGAERGCLTPEPPSKDVAVIDYFDGKTPDGPPPGEHAKVDGGTRPGSAHVVDEVSEKVELRQRRDGRWEGRLTLTEVGAHVAVRVRDRNVAQTILDSARIVAVDTAGCATNAPTGKKVRPGLFGPGNVMVPASPVSVSVCRYGPALLDASILLESGNAQRLATLLNHADLGPNPNSPPSTCGDTGNHEPVRLLFHYADRGDTEVVVSFEGCTDRRLDNGRRVAQVTPQLLASVMNPLHLGYGYSAPLGDEPTGK